MLFAVKRRLGPTLALLALFIGLALAAKAVLGLEWRWDIPPMELLLGVLALVASDGLLHGTLTLVLGSTYRRRYRALVEYFRSQRLPEIVAGGLLAGSEELIFRGVLQQGLCAHVSDEQAVAIAAVVFGLFHAIPSRTLLPFALWAVWEGALLGTVFVLSGSLGVVVVLHILHDIAGFGLFALQRQTGWLLGSDGEA